MGQSRRIKRALRYVGFTPENGHSAARLDSLLKAHWATFIPFRVAAIMR
jgi:hypothetical protein